ncbi:beta-lactamase superfamily domain-containing protein [Mycena crocata]|nr:beta-lactamase superfamily domain-containing protein [Mycena crocata]
MSTASSIAVKRLDSRPPPSSTSPSAHHVGNPPTSFRNPWPSFSGSHNFLSMLQIRFSSSRNFIPVPASRDELVPIRTPDWGSTTAGLKATWIGHASFLVETRTRPGAARGVRVLLDPVFSERTSPVSFAGPKRFSPPPCALEDLPEIDVVAISHDHYDHLDAATIRFINQRRAGSVRFLCALGGAAHLVGMGVDAAHVTELDWWDGAEIVVDGVGSVNLVCTPAQHQSGRTPWDKYATLWCSWVLEDKAEDEVKRLFFAGDTGYRTIPSNDPMSPTELAAFPHCPAFAEIGVHYGPFALALLPIGCYLPRTFMSAVHCAPEDAVCIHNDIRSLRSIGMHYGTLRGGLSQEYEDVREPPRRWKEACQAAGLQWGSEVGLCDIGETVVV